MRLQLFNELTETFKKEIEMMAGIILTYDMKLRFKTHSIRKTMRIHDYCVFSKF